MKNRNPNLDLLRFIAANLVVLCHVVYIEWGGVGHLGRLRPLGDLGYLGVDVFFAISGYVISLSAVDRQAKDFLISRFIRLFPGLFLAALIAALCMQSKHAPVHTNIFGDVSSLFLLNTATGTQSSNPVFWTLAYEFKFYIIISILLLLHKNTLINIRTAAIFWLFISFILIPYPGGILGSIFIPDYAPCFIFGILLSGIKSRKELFQNIPILSVTLTLAINNRLQEWKTLPVYRQQWHSATLTGLTLLLLFALFAVAVYVPLHSKKFTKITYKLGSYSYPIYLFHFTPMLTLLSALYAKTHHAVSAVLISYLAMLLLSIVFAEMIEPKLKKILKRAMV